jgi:hypothetical protein
MGTSATTTNTAATVVDTILKEALDLGMSALELALNAEVPFTALPVVKQLIDMGLSWVEGQIYAAIAEQGVYLVLKVQTAIEKSNFNQAMSDLKNAQSGSDPLVLQAAEQAFANAASSLIRSDGSFHP